MRSNKKLGQNFLVNQAVAEAEAAHSIEKNVLELGPGHGMLTKALCANAARVVAVERDPWLCQMLEAKMMGDNLTLINADFFELDDEQLMLKDTDILIANIPYSLSSKTIEWLHSKKMEAVLCLQKEFVQHMMAQPDTHNYSKLSVMCALCFRITEIMNVPRRHFRPKPKVDSEVIYIRPVDVEITDEEERIINLLMMHKKKTLKNAIMDSKEELKVKATPLSEFLKKNVCAERVFKMSPEEILEVSRMIIKLQKL